MATPAAGLHWSKAATATWIAAGGASADAIAVVDAVRGPDGVLWAGTYGKGLWRVQGGDPHALYTHGRRAFERPDPLALSGLRRDPVDRHFRRRPERACATASFRAFTAKDGLLSDNIANIADDGESLWLSTTRGICRVSKAAAARVRRAASGSVWSR